MNLNEIKTLEDLKLAKNKFYGPNGEIFALTQKLKTANKDEKILIGKQIKTLKENIEIQFQLLAEKIEKNKIYKQIENEWIDVEEPLYNNSTLHPLTLIIQRIKEWFLQNGYFEMEESEITNDEYNFERLNIPKSHPAREMQDSLFFDENILLRTHNTGISALVLEKNKNKSFAQFSIGKVYRNDEDDQTHSHQFTQLDFVNVGYVNFPNLIWTLKSFLSYVLEEKVEIRLRPSYFPFTEPSVEVDVLYKNNWIEVLGAGMLHHNVLKIAGYTNDMNAFAAGIGIERLAMIKYKISDIRELYKNDLRFLNQFRKVK
ncbi:phenylalanine--tRNA ligase subunit alpha [Mesomycoplasma neurolyticum]|uniref:phenylalanine--tRNA ligase n=1 Tax=Mesomycoplasma neurolyticum TaxID=2120 RepID=A0A449A4K4_9BACT|nr:phenylalanine--tRNA ligase subunit alpha [Mesomycoplasma neurolyticum]VEU59144.1 phenylalanyl-tRNA synthetase subunit alpha [Mesomycoplasma neurolyticum]